MVACGADNHNNGRLERAKTKPIGCVFFIRLIDQMRTTKSRSFDFAQQEPIGDEWIVSENNIIVSKYTTHNILHHN